MKKVSKSVKKQLINIFILLLLIGVTIVVLYGSNDELNFGSIWDFLVKGNKWLLAAAVVCAFAAIVLEGLSILHISRTLGNKTRLFPSLVYSTADFYFSSITPSATGGQPASAYYMVKDGMSVGTASFTLVFNLIAYTATLVILGALALLLRPTIFLRFEVFPQILIIAGMVVQTLLTVFFVACMRCHGAVLKVGNAIIGFLTKIKIMKKPDKWREKMTREIEKYADCLPMLRKHKMLFFNALVLNMAQRVARASVSCFVCLAVAPDAPILELFVLQALLMVGYTTIPLPGGVGVYEYLYLRIYVVLFDKAFILAAMMVVRVISFYLCMVVCGIITLIYHMCKRKRSA